MTASHLSGSLVLNGLTGRPDSERGDPRAIDASEDKPISGMPGHSQTACGLSTGEVAEARKQ